MLLFGHAGGQSLSNRGLLLDTLCFSNGEHGACDKCREHGNCRINEKTDEQLDYIFSSIEESIFLKACPGSGKTEVVAIKAAHEISNWDKNGGIAILSFTNNAADVITERVSDFTGLESVAHPHFIGTFDSWLHTYVAHPFLFHYSKYKGDKENDFDFSFKLIDPSSGAGFLNSFATKYQYNGTGKPFANQYYYETYEEKWVFSSGERTVDASRNNMALENWRVLELLTTKTEFWKAGFANYQDVELMCAELLEEQAKLCGLLVNRFPYVIIDEAQDLSAGQLNIVEKLKKRGCQIHFVGDIQQSIYKFKKVDPSFVEKFSDKNVMKKMQLTNNFRSNQSIVDFSNKIIPPIGTIKGNANIENADCRFVSFKKTEMAKLPKWFEEHLEKFDDIDIQKSAIITRGKSSISKMRPSANYGLKLPHEIAMAIKMWSDGHSENLPDAIHMTGKFIANKFFSEFSAMPTQFYRPEIISKTSNWRSFIAAILNEITAVDGIIDLDKKWSEWAKILKKSFPDIIQKKQSDLGYSKYSYSFSLSKLSFSSPKGQKNNKVIDTIGYVERTATEISIKTIHAVKGQTLDAVMVVSSPTKGNDGHWEKWLEDSTKEPARFAYVASSRPKQVLVWAVPEVDNVQKNKLIGLGMLETDWEDS